MDFFYFIPWLEQNGYWAIFAGMFLEGLCLPIPAELVLGFAGFLVGQGKLSFAAAILAGWLGSLGGSLLAYLAARKYGCRLLHKYGSLCGLTSERIASASRFFHKYGPAMIVPWRQLPVVRNKISLVAGITELPFPIFLLYITLGTGLWSLLGISLGTYLGANWQVLLKLASGFSTYLLLITVSLGTAIAIVLYGRYLKTK